MILSFEALAALKPSQYRKFLKDWDRRLLEPVFKKNGAGDKKHRIYIPFGKLGGITEIDAPEEVASILEGEGVRIENYLQGIGMDKHGRLVKLGKVLRRASFAEEEYQSFMNDPRRALVSKKDQDMFIVISRHPYDVAGMSTGRGWESCMNLDTGVNRHYVGDEIEAGTLIAYLISGKDTNINKPIARALIKPYYHDLSTHKQRNPNTTAVYVVDNVYPASIPAFSKFLTKWVNENINKGKTTGHYKLNLLSYDDGKTGHTHIDDIEDFIERSNAKPKAKKSFARMLDGIEDIDYVYSRIVPELRPAVVGARGNDLSEASLLQDIPALAHPLIMSMSSREVTFKVMRKFPNVAVALAKYAASGEDEEWHLFDVAAELGYNINHYNMKTVLRVIEEAVVPANKVDWFVTTMLEETPSNVSVSTLRAFKGVCGKYINEDVISAAVAHSGSDELMEVFGK